MLELAGIAAVQCLTTSRALSAVELLDAFARRTLDPVEVAEATLTRIERLEPGINAFVTVTAERARADARARLRRLGRRHRGPALRRARTR